MKISPIQNMSFQKKLVAKCNYIESDEKTPCKIYELDADNEKDIKYYERLFKDDNWKKYFYLENVESEITAGVETRYFVMENNEKECLAICEVDDVYDDKNELLYLETIPSKRSENKSRSAKYIGETLLTFLVGLTKKENKESFTISSPRDQAVLFYKKCGFRINDFDDDMSMTNAKFQNLLNQNEQHVGKMEYII